MGQHDFSERSAAQPAGKDRPDRPGIVRRVRLQCAQYLVRHWRGDFSLTHASLLLGAALAVVALAVALWLARPLDAVVDDAMVALVLTAAWSGVALVTLWQAVGIWRAADRHGRIAGGWLWPRTVKLVVLFGVTVTGGVFVRAGLPQIVEASQLAVGVDPIGEVSVEVVRDGREVELNGPIVFGLTDRVRAVFEEHPGIEALTLSSPGGRVAEARKLRDLIRAHGVTTIARGNCASACTVVFMAGSERLVVRGSTIGFHRYRSSGLDESEIDASMRIDRRALAAQGVPDWFLERAFSTPNSEMWRPPVDDLRRAGIVTGEVRADRTVVWRDRGSIERELLQTPLYATLRTHEPEAYEQVLDAMEQGTQRGLTVQDISSRARPLIARLAAKYLPAAADHALVQAAEVATRTMRVLGAHSVDDCLRYIKPDGGTADLSLVPESLKRQDLAATAAIIESGARQPRAEPGETVEDDLHAVFARVTSRHADAALVLDGLGTSHTDPATACAVVLDLYEAALELPAPRNAQLLRFLLAGA